MTGKPRLSSRPCAGIQGGEVWTPDGTKIGKAKGVGGDRLTVRRDNKGQLDVRATAQVRAAPPQVCTSSPSYAWVNGCQFVNIEELSFDENVIVCDTYALR